MAKKYLTYTGLEEYDGLIKAYVDSSDSTLETQVSDITSGTTKVASATHADSADTATSATTATTATTASKLGSSTIGSTSQPIYLNSGTATEVTSVGVAYGGTGATDAASARTNLDVYSTTEVDTKLSGKSDSGHNHDSVYDAKGSASSALAEAKTYADSAVAALVNGAPETLDTLDEIAAALEDNADIVDVLNASIANKANQTDLESLTTTVTGKSDAGHTHSNYASTVTTTGSGNAITAISQSGNTITATKGSTFLTAHPTVSVSNDTTSTATASHGGTITMVDGVTRDSNGHVTKINTKTVTLPSDNNTDTKVTQAYSTTSSSYPLLMTATSGVSSTSSRGATTSILNNQIYANPSTGVVTAKTFSGALSGNATSATTATTASTLSGLTATVTELNYMDGVTSNVQTQIGTLTSAISANTSSISSHTTSIATLQAELDEFVEVTSDEIAALFA